MAYHPPEPVSYQSHEGLKRDQAPRWLRVKPQVSSPEGYEGLHAV